MRHLRRLIAAAAVAAVALGAGALPADANHAWAGYHWARTSNPFMLKLGDNVSSQWDGILATTSSDWSASSVLNTATVAGAVTNLKRCPATPGRVEVCNTTYGSNGWLGIASVWTSGGHITQGTVKVNDTYFSRSPYNTVAWRNLVMCQEVGHTLGLDHQDESFSNANLGTCMDYTNSPGTNQHPNAHDYAQLESIYAHLDSTTTVGAASAPSPVPADGGNNASQWGRAIRHTADGRADLFVREFGGGQRLYTHVFWAS